MSTKHSQNKNTTKKTKLDKVDENVGSIAEYKRCAILKYCEENVIKTNYLNKLDISNEFQILGLYCFVIFTIISTFLKSMKVF